MTLEGTPTLPDVKLNSRIRYWYSRPDVQEAMYVFMEDREVVVFDKTEERVIVPRPYRVDSPEDIGYLVKEKGAASFHCTTERWKDFELLFKGKYPEAVDTFDLVIDIDLVSKSGKWVSTVNLNKKVVDYVLRVLEKFEVYREDVLVKYSGNKGFHIIIPWCFVPKEVMGRETKYIKDQVCECILVALDYIVSRLLNIDGSVIDTVVAAWRHPIRSLYSLHMKTGLPSVPVNPNNVREFDPTKLVVKEMEVYPYEFKNKDVQTELEDLIKIGLFIKSKVLILKDTHRKKGKVGRIKFDVKVLDDPSQQELLPPCLRNILKGVEDGRKRALFVLENFFAWYGMSYEEIKELLYKWNDRNPDPLKENYIESKLNHLFNRVIPCKGNPYLPYNCGQDSFYSEIGVCNPDEICSQIKNPIQYPKVKIWLKKSKQREQR